MPSNKRAEGSGTRISRNSVVSVILPLDPNVNSEVVATPSSVVNDPPMPMSPVAESNAAMAAGLRVISTTVPMSAAVIVRLP